MNVTGVDKRNPYYKKFLPIWEKSRDVIEGEESVKSENTKYLPALGKPTDIDYENNYQAYLARAMFNPASQRTLVGLLGALFRIEPDISMSESMNYLLVRSDRNNQPLSLFIREITSELLSIGRFGVLVEMKSNQECVLVPYIAESITNWRIEKLETGENVLTQVILFEEREVPAEDGFGYKIEPSYLELVLEDGVYTQKRYVEATNKSKSGSTTHWVLTETIIPKKKGESLDYIPFICFAPDSLSLESNKTSPLLPLINVSLSYYRSSADLEHGRHFTGLPTPYITGVSREKFKGMDISIGSPKLLRFDSKDAKVGMLEFTGAGLQYLENALKDKQQLMIFLGSKLLEPQKGGIESAEALRLRQGGETSVLSSLSDLISLGVTKLLHYIADWQGITSTEEIKVTINKDFFDVRLSPQDITALVQSWQANAISQEVVIYNFRQGEILPPEMTDEEVMLKAKEEATEFQLTFESQQQQQESTIE